MWAIGCSLLTTSMIILGATGADHFHRPGRRICSSGTKTGDVLVTQSFVQPVYHPLLTLCEGHRACSTYRTTYKTAYRQVMKKMAPQPLYACCPGWKRMDSHIQGCGKVSCPAPCRNGGTCIGYNKCKCASGWRGDLCQTDVDECTMGSHRCAHTCVNTPGSFLCVCRDGFRLSADGRSCDQEKPTATQPPPPPANGTGVPESIKEEIQELRNKIEVLEQKLQLVLAPFNNPSTSSPEDALGSITLLTHSFQQLDRIDSLSEQISFLEERLETCSCKNEL